MQIKALAVDLGGVMVLPDSIVNQAWMAQHLNMPVGVVERDLWYGIDVEAANRGKITAEEYARRTAHRLGVPANRVLYVIETIFAGSLNRPLANWLAGLPPGLRIAAFTNNWSFAGRILKRHQIYDTFDLVVNSAEVGCCKPEPEIYTALLERLGLLAGEVVVVDDHSDNIATAEALGFPAVQYTTLDSCILRIEKILDQGCLG